MLNSNGVKEIQRYAFNGSSLEEVYAILNYCSDTKTEEANRTEPTYVLIMYNFCVFICSLSPGWLAGWITFVLFKMFW